MFRKRKSKTDDIVKIPKMIVADTQKDTKPAAALIVAITAAVAVCMSTSANGIVIRSLRRCRQSAPEWSAAGRKHQISQQF